MIKFMFNVLEYFLIGTPCKFLSFLLHILKLPVNKIVHCFWLSHKQSLSDLKCTQSSDRHFVPSFQVVLLTQPFPEHRHFNHTSVCGKSALYLATFHHIYKKKQSDILWFWRVFGCTAAVKNFFFSIFIIILCKTPCPRLNGLLK